jgi:hypothetical protein
MLFSILIGAAATVYFLARALVIKAKVFFSGGKSAVLATGRKSFVIYCEGKQYWNVFKPVLDEFEARKTELCYLTSAEDDPVFEAGYQYVKPEYIGEGNRAFARLNMLSAEVVLMTTPGLDVYQLKRSKAVKHYAHILHAPSDATMYRLFGLDYYDSVLLTGDYQAADIRYLEEKRGITRKTLTTVGCTYLDEYAAKMRYTVDGAAAGALDGSAALTVLVSPSWGQSALLAKYGSRLLDPLVKTGWKVIVRPHPQSKKSEMTMLTALEARYKDTPNLEWDYERDNIYSLSKADVMISDFSGIIFDYTFLRDKPVLYTNQNIDLRPYDADDICSDENGKTDVLKLWQFRALKEFGIELKEEMFSRINEVIEEALNESGAGSAAVCFSDARRRARNAAWMHPGEAGKRAVDFMMSARG